MELLSNVGPPLNSTSHSVISKSTTSTSFTSNPSATTPTLSTSISLKRPGRKPKSKGKKGKKPQS
ncbi:hypothetical protein NEOLEDRAFT_1142870, partial [Neolentinus lepideus HHB14362 ss-1]